MLPGKNTPAFRALGLALGLLLLGGAIAFALGRADWAQLQRAAPAQAFQLAGAILVNLFLTALLFWVVTLSFDAKPAVGLGRMLALISASALLNYLPLQAGSIGRAAYLKLRNDLPLRQSVLIQLIIAVITMVVPLSVVLVMLTPGPVRGLAALIVAGGVVGLTKPAAEALLRRKVVAAWSWMPLRLADLSFTALRMWIAFAMIGQPASYLQALAIAAAIMVVNLVSLTPNGLGFREWVAAAVSALAGAGLGPAGVLATLVDRAVEAVVFIGVGLLASVWLRRDSSPISLRERVG